MLIWIDFTKIIKCVKWLIIIGLLLLVVYYCYAHLRIDIIKRSGGYEIFITHCVNFMCN
jgi:hypothetical protein